MDKLHESYVYWLCALVGTKHNRSTYGDLMNSLHQKAFYWSVPNDDNRVHEGKNLRERFCDEIGVEYIYDDFPEQASMLEILIGLAYRCESIMVDQGDSMEMSEWFWKIISNVGLDKYTDDRFVELNGGTQVEVILNRVIERTYDKDGNGGLFPLKNSKKDQRKVELWYQMNAYLVEKYYSREAVV